MKEIEKTYIEKSCYIERIIKRSIDIILSGGCLIIFSPLFVLISLAIRWEDGLPVIFSQERIGRYGKPFHIYKFRSMKIDAEKDRPNLLETYEDPRLTKSRQISASPSSR